MFEFAVHVKGQAFYEHFRASGLQLAGAAAAVEKTTIFWQICKIREIKYLI